MMLSPFVARGAACLAVLLGAACLFTAWQSWRIARAFPPQGTFVTLPGGARLHYTERRPSGATRGTVLLLHGASGNQADMMMPLGDRLAGMGFRVVAFDRPGHGWSDRPDGAADASPARQAGMLREALREIGVAQAIVVGHSWSGALAADFALDHADVTQGLVLLAPVLYPWPGGVAWYYGPAASLWLGPVFTHALALPAGLLLMDAGVREVFAPETPPPDYARRTGLFLVLRPAEFTANAQDVLGLHDFVSLQGPRMATIAVPTAILVGDGDRVVSPELHALRAAREIPGSTLEVLHGVGHSPHWSAPDRVAAAIADLADRVSYEIRPNRPEFRIPFR